MGLRCEINVEDMGLPLETYQLGIPIDYSAALDTFCDVFLSVSTELVPVDTGYLRSTLDADNDGVSSAEAWTDCEYAQYQEYGTWCMGAQPYFEPAIEAAMDEMMPLLEEAYQEAMAEEQEILAEMAAQMGGEDDDSGGGIGLFDTILVALAIGFVQGLFAAFKQALSYDDKKRYLNVSGGYFIDII